jgi:hypothetical protein
MNRITQIVLLILFFVAASHPQERATGLSKPGSIGRRKPTYDIPPGESRLVCSVSIQDPLDDGMLNEGESVTLNVLIRNFTHDKFIHPKLEIQKYFGRLQRPSMEVIWLTRLAPGEMITYDETVEWSDDLSAEIILLKYRAFDARIGLTSESIEIRFDIDNSTEN